MKAESLKGSLLNDLHLAVCLRRAKDTKWVVRTNPYEGGSDHTAFADAGVPSLLNWHFTDRYYHTNLDRPDKTSPLEMTNVGVAGRDERLVSRLGRRARRGSGRRPPGGVGRRAPGARAEAGRRARRRRRGSRAAQATETAVLAAWRKWYDEALDSVRRLPAKGASAGLDARIAQAQQRAQAQ